MSRSTLAVQWQQSCWCVRSREYGQLRRRGKRQATQTVLKVLSLPQDRDLVVVKWITVICLLFLLGHIVFKSTTHTSF